MEQPGCIGLCVGPCVGTRSSADDMIDHVCAYPEALLLSLFEHPQQRIFGERALFLNEAAAYVRMAARKPDLADILSGKGLRLGEKIGLECLRLRPPLDPEHSTEFVDRNRVPERPHCGILGGVGSSSKRSLEKGRRPGTIIDNTVSQTPRK